MPAPCEICSFDSQPDAAYCARCGIRTDGAPSDPFRASFVARAGAAIIHGNGFLASFGRFVLKVPLSILVLLTIVHMVLAWGGGKSWMGVLMLACLGFVGVALPVEDHDRGARRALLWAGRVVWGLALLMTLLAATERTPLRP